MLLEVKGEGLNPYFRAQKMELYLIKIRNKTDISNGTKLALSPFICCRGGDWSRMEEKSRNPIPNGFRFGVRSPAVTTNTKEIHYPT